MEQQKPDSLHSPVNDAADASLASEQAERPVVGAVSTEQDALDAARYRWLLNPTLPVAIHIDGKLPFAVGETIDAAIATKRATP